MRSVERRAFALQLAKRSFTKLMVINKLNLTIRNARVKRLSPLPRSVMRRSVTIKGDSNLRRSKAEAHAEVAQVLFQIGKFGAAY